MTNVYKVLGKTPLAHIVEYADPDTGVLSFNVMDFNGAVEFDSLHKAMEYVRLQREDHNLVWRYSEFQNVWAAYRLEHLFSDKFPKRFPKLRVVGPPKEAF